MKKGLLLLVGVAVCCSAIADRDLTQAERLEITEAAESGDALAQFMVAMGLLTEAEVDPEYADWAVILFRRAADQGLAIAQVMLGALYHTGFGQIEQDFSEAIRWYRLAADRRLVIAQLKLATTYAHGDGVPEDPTEAVYWYRLAAERGEVRAQIGIATHYHEGRGVPKDVVRAYAWLVVAAAQDADAEVDGERVATARDRYAAEHLTARQLAEGTRLAHELWNRRRTARHPLMVQTPFPSGEARELRARVLAALSIDVEMPAEPVEFKTHSHQLALVFRRMIFPSELTVQGRRPTDPVP